MKGCEDIHRVNLPLHAVELRQLPPYQLLEYLEKIWKVPRGFPRKYLIGCYQMRGVATGALGRTPPRTPT